MPQSLEGIATICASAGHPLTEAQLLQFGRLLESLKSANSVKNLTRVPEAEWEIRHLVESCLILPWIQSGARVLDLGTGPGFPALPLAIARADLDVVALDSNAKMLDFAIKMAIPNVKPLLGRIEDQAFCEQFDVVTGRAFAPLPIQLECSTKPLKVGGICLPFRTESDVLEGPWVGELGFELTEVHRVQATADGPMRVFPEYRKVRRTPGKYPRLWATMKAKPLG